MKPFVKPTLLLSKCLHHIPCRYDGTAQSSPIVDALETHVNWVEVCPEVGMGLGIPRQSLRIITSDQQKLCLVMRGSNHDYTDKMNTYSQQIITDLKANELHGAILKSRSPSCGLKDVKYYKSMEKGGCTLSKNNNGLFTDALMNAFPSLPMENEGRLTNYNIRSRFFTHIFALARLNRIQEKGQLKDLIAFHSEYKYLLMAYSPGYLRQMGKIVANHTKDNLNRMIGQYRILLHKALSMIPKPMRHVNMLLHLFGYFSKELSNKEKAYFLDVLEEYQQKKVPFSVPLSIIHAWVVRFENPYLMHQIIFEPFPNDLLNTADSGKD